MKYSIGIDIGSTSTQLVVLDLNSKEIVFLDSLLTSAYINQTVEVLFTHAKKFLGCNEENFKSAVATGYGRKICQLNGIKKSEITEITCYAKGALFFNNKIRTIIDIGGQDSKVISLGENGAVVNFVMNDKCAAGTGKFLEMIAKQFDIDLEKLSLLSKNSTKHAPISNICAVFAQSEIINMISRGIALEDIVKSAEISIVSRIFGMAERMGLKKEIMFCGGVAKNRGMIGTLEEKLGVPVCLPKYVEFVGAVGAALFAAAEL